MTQITVRLSPEIRARFDSYAAEVGLDASELARLLIIRELRARRILPLPKRKPHQPAALADRIIGSRKLTAHFHSPEPVSDFDKYARAHGLTRAAAAKLIFERELRETWLAKAFAWTPKAGSLRLIS